MVVVAVAVLVIDVYVTPRIVTERIKISKPDIIKITHTNNILLSHNKNNLLRQYSLISQTKTLNNDKKAYH